MLAPDERADARTYVQHHVARFDPSPAPISVLVEYLFPDELLGRRADGKPAPIKVPDSYRIGGVCSRYAKNEGAVVLEAEGDDQISLKQDQRLHNTAILLGTGF